MILERDQIIALGMSAHGLIFHIYHVVEFWCKFISQPDQSILFYGQCTIQDLPHIICIIRILTVLQKELQSCSIPVEPVLFLIAAFIDPFVILRDQSVHFPDLKEPRLVILFDHFPGLLIDPDEYLIRTLPQCHIVDLIVFGTDLVCDIGCILEPVHTHLVEVLR